MGQCLLIELGAKTRKKGSIVVDNASIDIYGDIPQKNVTFTYIGNGTLTAESSNTNVAKITLITGNYVTVTYVGAGNATITINASKTSKFTEATASFSVNCYRSALTKPSLATTSYYSPDGTSQSPGYNNYNSGLMTVSGTTSADTSGTYAIYFDIKDKIKYCWSDGTDSTLSYNWSITAYIFDYSIDAYSAPGASNVYFHNNKGGASGNYNWYAPDGIYIEMKGDIGDSVLYKYVDFTLKRTIPAGRTLYVALWCDKFTGLEDNGYRHYIRVYVSSDGSSYTQAYRGRLPQGTISMTVPINTTHIKIEPWDNCNTTLHKIYY